MKSTRPHESTSLPVISDVPDKSPTSGSPRKFALSSKTIFYAGLFWGAIVLAVLSPHFSGWYIYLTELVGTIQTPYQKMLATNCEPRLPSFRDIWNC